MPDILEFVAQKKQSFALPWMHWLNFPLLMIMMFSGMRIYWSDLQEPYAIGIGGWHLFEFWPDGVNSALQLERKLAKGTAFHLTFSRVPTEGGATTGLGACRAGLRGYERYERSPRELHKHLSRHLPRSFSVSL